MKRTLVVTFLWLGCARSEAPPASSTPVGTTAEVRTETAPPTTPSTPSTPSAPAAVRNIEIDEVEIANPLVVRGRARAFENNVVLRARDERGVVITQTFTTAQGEMGQHSPFEGSIWLTRDPGRRVIVEALEYSARDGSEQALVSVSRPFDVEPARVQLYLPNDDCTAVRAETRTVPKSLSMARLLIETLMAEPAPFPKGSRVKSVNLRDGTLRVDFNERLQNVGGACAAQMIRESVTRTLMTLPSVRRLVITAGGSESLALQP